MQSLANRSDAPAETMTITEIAERMGISVTVAYALAKKNELPVPVFKVGRQYRVSRRAYESLMSAQHEVPATHPDETLEVERSSRDDLLPLERAAKRCGTSLDTLRRRVASGELTVYVDGRDRRRRLVSMREVEAISKSRPCRP